MNKHLIVVPLVLLFCFTFACQDKASMGELATFKSHASVETQNKALLSRTWEAWNRRDLEAWKQMHAEDYAYYSPSGGSKPMTREETMTMGKTWFAAFPDTVTAIEDLIPAGDQVITRWKMRATHKGDFEGIPATGKTIECSGIMISRVANGKIVEDREDADMLGFMLQLGMELKPKAPMK